MSFRSVLSEGHTGALCTIQTVNASQSTKLLHEVSVPVLCMPETAGEVQPGYEDTYQISGDMVHSQCT